MFSLKEKYLTQALLNLDSSLGIFDFHRIHHLILGILELFVPQKKPKSKFPGFSSPPSSKGYKVERLNLE